MNFLASSSVSKNILLRWASKQYRSLFLPLLPIDNRSWRVSRDKIVYDSVDKMLDNIYQFRVKVDADEKVTDVDNTENNDEREEFFFLWHTINEK